MPHNHNKPYNDGNLTPGKPMGNPITSHGAISLGKIPWAGNYNGGPNGFVNSSWEALFFWNRACCATKKGGLRISDRVAPQKALFQKKTDFHEEFTKPHGLTIVISNSHGIAWGK